ncbi:MAG: VCBS repeat-containing protein, partial [Planctomycetales bacterium]|nr:VCBS repeat-containing protein [Planctomycetales bacterium]
MSQGDQALNAGVSQTRQSDADAVSLHNLIRAGRSFSGHERNVCFLNTGTPRFADVSAISNLDLADDGRGLAITDWDQDGDLDVWAANRNGPQVRFLRNEVPTSHHYVALS